MGQAIPSGISGLPKRLRPGAGGCLGDSERIGLIQSIEELYTFSPLINRTRRRDIGEFTTRKPKTLTVEFTEDQKRLHDGVLAVIAQILARCHGQQNVKFMMTTIRRQAASCLYGLAPFLSDILGSKLDRLELLEASDNDDDADFSFLGQVRGEIESLLEQARNLDSHDPKVEAFIKVLLDKDKLPNNKALVFSTFRHTLAYLDTHARGTGLRIGLIHGDVSDDERSDLRHRFALPKEEADAIDVLLSSEVGCEGLDFQFCDLLVNYDLPWNPMRIEQRIGRIDRYGQRSETVAIVNFVTPGTVDADIYRRCLWRIGVFQHAVGGNEEILGTITQELHDIAESFSLNEEERARRLQQLADNGIRQIREEQELELKQAELFGLNVPNQTWLADIQAARAIRRWCCCCCRVPFVLLRAASTRSSRPAIRSAPSTRGPASAPRAGRRAARRRAAPRGRGRRPAGRRGLRLRGHERGHDVTLYNGSTGPAACTCRARWRRRPGGGELPRVPRRPARTHGRPPEWTAIALSLPACTWFVPSYAPGSIGGNFVWPVH